MTRSERRATLIDATVVDQQDEAEGDWGCGDRELHHVIEPTVRESEDEIDDRVDQGRDTDDQGDDAEDKQEPSPPRALRFDRHEASLSRQSEGACLERVALVESGTYRSASRWRLSAAWDREKRESGDRASSRTAGFAGPHT